MKSKLYILIGLYIILASLILIPHLGSNVLMIWDETRLATNAFEMSQSGNLLVTTFDYSAEHWNTKPPLLIWLQALSIKLLSPSEVAVRLPSVLAMIAMGIGLILGFNKLKHLYTGFFCAILCLGCEGLVRYHCFRSADYDGLMICFMMLYLLFFFIFTQTKERKYLILFFVFLILDTMTKGIQSLIPLPALLIYLAITKQLNTVFKEKYTYFGIIISVIIVLSYYFAREIADNGYIKDMIANEITGRYGSVLENHKEPALYYFQLMRDKDFVVFLPLVPIAIFYSYFANHGISKQVTSYFLLISVFYFLIITLGQTKCGWYHFPILPMLSVIIGVSLDCFIQTVKEKYPKSKLMTISVTIAVVIFLSFPLYSVFENNIKHKADFFDFYCGNYLCRDIAKGKLQVDNIHYIMDNYDNNQNSFFYWHWMEYKGKTIYRINLDGIKEGMLIQVNKEDNFKKIQDRFNIEELYSLNQARIIKIKDKKQ